MNTYQYTAAVAANKGKRRSNNEDNFYFDGVYLVPENRDEPFSQVAQMTDPQIMLGVFDGMGGESFGEKASLILAETTSQYHLKIRKEDQVILEPMIEEMIHRANTRIHTEIDRENVRQMGTTFTFLSVQNDRIQFSNVGDSRSFRMHDGKLEQVSVDDTTVKKLVDLGVITPEEAKTHKDRHKITQYVGMRVDDTTISIHFSDEYDVVPGDRFLLSSDGLTDMVEQERIEEVLREIPDLQQAAQALVNEAMHNGGKDNITVILLEASTAGAARTGKSPGGREARDPLGNAGKGGGDDAGLPRLAVPLIIGLAALIALGSVFWVRHHRTMSPAASEPSVNTLSETPSTGVAQTVPKQIPPGSIQLIKPGKIVTQTDDEEGIPVFILTPDYDGDFIELEYRDGEGSKKINRYQTKNASVLSFDPLMGDQYRLRINDLGDADVIVKDKDGNYATVRFRITDKENDSENASEDRLSYDEEDETVGNGNSEDEDDEDVAEENTEDEDDAGETTESNGVSKRGILSAGSSRDSKDRSDRSDS